MVCSDNQVEKETSNCTYFDLRTQTLFDLTPLKDLKQVWPSVVVFMDIPMIFVCVLYTSTNCC